MAQATILLSSGAAGSLTDPKGSQCPAGLGPQGLRHCLHLLQLKVQDSDQVQDVHARQAHYTARASSGLVLMALHSG